ncbi:hypothetical protein VIBNISFn118_620019 [Vibrio nigripulchritudo SFn118]|nr:hypothetical protein VIBNISFn118_620019 [Vibrio nigripulchritudo SFn118]
MPKPFEKVLPVLEKWKTLRVAVC